MHDETTDEHASLSKTEKLRRQVGDASTDVARLAALVALAHHLADASDGVNGLTTAREARSLALRLKNYPAAANALCSASVSHYHRSDYVSAVATAMDAWDFATRAASPPEIAESHVALSLSLLALGALDASSQLIEKALLMTRQDPGMLDVRIRLVGLKAMLRFLQDDIEGTELLCAETVALAEGSTISQLALSHGNWGIALLRHAEKRIAAGGEAMDLLLRSREHLELALRLAEQEIDEMRIADRTALLGMVAMLAGDLPRAEALLNEALQRSLALDYVRTAVASSVYLGKICLQRGDADNATRALRQSVALAMRGVAADTLPAAQLLLADALEMRGDDYDAALLRTGSEKLRTDNAHSRSRAAEDAIRLVSKILTS